MNPDTTHDLSTKEGFLDFLRTHPAKLLLSSEPEEDGTVYHYYDMEGLPKGVHNGANLKACLAPDCAEFVVPDVDSSGCIWWVYTPHELGIHPAACTLLMAMGADALALLRLPKVQPGEIVSGDLFAA